MYTTGMLAKLLNAELIGPGDIAVVGVEALDRAGEGLLTFIRDADHARRWPASCASAAIVARRVARDGLVDVGKASGEMSSSARALLVVDDVDLALIRVLDLFAPERFSPPRGIHAAAVVDPSASVASDAAIGPFCVVGPRARIGAGAVLISHVAIGEQAEVGEETVLHPGVVIGARCRIGRRCLFHPGVVIGADGFGFVPAPAGRGLVKIPHIGNVVIGDEVEIGANSCVDRAKFGSTEIGSGTKIDNLVQIGHNCRIGRACLLCGQVGLAGSVVLGDGVILAGGVGVADHVRIGDRARVGGRSAVASDVPPGETWLGMPALPAARAARNYAVFRNLADELTRLRHLERRLERAGLLAPQSPAASASPGRPTEG